MGGSSGDGVCYSCYGDTSEECAANGEVCCETNDDDDDYDWDQWPVVPNRNHPWPEASSSRRPEHPQGPRETCDQAGVDLGTRRQEPCHQQKGIARRSSRGAAISRQESSPQAPQSGTPEDAQKRKGS